LALLFNQTQFYQFKIGKPNTRLFTFVIGRAIL
jgi:hypothetical protein